MKDVMIDLETLGTKPYSAIVSIGACYFDPNTGEIGDSFHTVMKWDSIFNQDREVDPETIKWWMKQEDNARLSILEGENFLSISLAELSMFLDKDCSPWGNGATFDISILENAYEGLGMGVPWKFWNVRDVRTVTAMAKDIGYDYKAANPRQGVYHDALDDAIYQAQYVSDIWQQITKGGL